MATPFLGSLLGLTTSIGGSVPKLFAGARERQLNQMAVGKGPSAASTMLQQQAAANARNALSIASAQPGGLGLLQGLRSAEEMNRTAGQQAANARVQEQMQAVGAAKQANDQRQDTLGRMGAAVGQFGSAFDAQNLASQQADKAQAHELKLAELNRQAPQPAGTPMTPAAAPATQLTPPPSLQPTDPNALPDFYKRFNLNRGF